MTKMNAVWITWKLPESFLKLLQYFLVLCSWGEIVKMLHFRVTSVCVQVFVCGMRIAYILDRVTCVTVGRLLRVCRVSWVRWGTVPKCVYSRHPGTSRECWPVLPKPFRTPSRLPPWSTRDSSSFILLAAKRLAAVDVIINKSSLA